jgi:hypothetical protein
MLLSRCILIFAWGDEKSAAAATAVIQILLMAMSSIFDVLRV